MRCRSTLILTHTVHRERCIGQNRDNGWSNKTKMVNSASSSKFFSVGPHYSFHLVTPNHCLNHLESVNVHFQSRATRLYKPLCRLVGPRSVSFLWILRLIDRFLGEFFFFFDFFFYSKRIFVIFCHFFILSFVVIFFSFCPF